MFPSDRSAATLHAWRRTVWGLAITILAIALFTGQAHAASVQAAPPPGALDTIVSYLAKLWPIIVCVGGLLLAGALLGLATRFTTVVDFKVLKTSVDTINEKVAAHETRIGKVEDHCTAPPTRIELSEDLAELAARMSGMEAQLQGLQAVGKTTNDYLHLLIERGLAK